MSLSHLWDMVIVMVWCTQQTRASAGCVKSVNQMCVKPVYTPPHFKPKNNNFSCKINEKMSISGPVRASQRGAVLWVGQFTIVWR